MPRSTLRQLIVLALLSSCPLAGELLRDVRIESGEAATTLRQYSLQTQANLIFSPDDIKGVVTNPVEGRLRRKDALERLLEDTALTFNEDSATGAFAIVRSKAHIGRNKDTDESDYSEPDKSLLKQIASVVLGSSKPSAVIRISSGEQVFDLNPFEVDVARDMGYVATSTLSGSRLNTRLSDTAASVSVITEEFLKDTGLSDVQEIAQYSLGTVNNTQETVADPNINNYISGANTLRRIRIRGIRATKGVNYFESLIPDDAYRSERYDESRGPNGVLFGISNAGGIVNTTTIRANAFRNSGRFQYSAGSYGRDRLEGRLNRVILEDKLAFTIAGVTQDNEGWRDFQNDKRNRLYGAVIWKPSDRITVHAIGETGRHHMVTLRPFNATDGFLAWYRNRELLGQAAVTGSPGLDGNNPDASLQALGVVGTLTNRANTRYVYVANDSTWFDGAGTWISGSYDDMNVARLPGSLMPSGIETDDPAKINNPPDFPYPYHLNASGPGMFRDTDFDTWSILADFRITEDLYLNFAHNFQKTTIDAQYIAGDEPMLMGDPNVTRRHPDKDDIDPGALNPYAGRLYFDANWRRDDHFAESRETRLSLSYDFSLESFGLDWLGRHRLGAGLASRSVSDNYLMKRWGFLGNPFHNRSFDHPNNRIVVRNYIHEGDFNSYTVAEPPPDQTTVLDDMGVTRSAGWVHSTKGTLNSRTDQEIDSFIAVLQSYFWNDKLVSIFGFRRNEVAFTEYGHIIDPLLGDTVTSDPHAVGYSVNDPSMTNTRTAGIVYHAHPNFSLLANYATSIGLPEFMNTVLPTLTVPPPIEGKGLDLGVSFKLLADRISGRLVYFETTEKNQTASGGITRILRDPNMLSMDALERVFADLRKPDGSPFTEQEWKREVMELAPDFNAVMQDNVSNGWELSLVANITRNWRITFNASKTDRITSNYGREAIKWLGWRKDQSGRLINGITRVGDPTAPGDWLINRSAYVSGSPVDRILEIAENAVGWDAGTLVTDNNDESIAEALFLQMAELQDEIDLREKRWGLSPYKLNVFSAYDFQADLLRGFTIGGGFRWLSGEIIGEDPEGLELKSPSVHFIDLLLRYRHEVRKGRGTIDYQVNVYNLLDKKGAIPVRYSILTDETSPLSRFRLLEPLTVRASVTYSF